MCEVKEAQQKGACTPCVVPFVQDSKTLKLLVAVVGRGGLDRGVTKVHREILWSDECIHYLGLGDGFMTRHRSTLLQSSLYAFI